MFGFYIVSRSTLNSYFVLVIILCCLLSGSLSEGNSPRGIDAGIVGYWSFDKKDIDGDTAMDRSGSGHNGTIHNGTSLVAGKVRQALDFDGKSTYVATPLRHSSVFTWSAWVKINSISNLYQSIITAPGIYHVFMGITRDRISIWSKGELSAYNFGVTNLIANQWYHVALVREGDSIEDGYKLYLDGELKGSVATKESKLSELETWIGARRGFRDQYFNGAIDEVRIYNRALSAEEVGKLYYMNVSQ